MAKLHFFYSTMNAGKSTSLLQANHNYIENNMQTLLFLPKENVAFNEGKIVSRIGIDAKANEINKDFNFFTYVDTLEYKDLNCILIDESQFLTKEQVGQLGVIADDLNIPVMCYGIRTDFRGELFEGSAALLALADNLIELKTVCSECSRKATMVVRLNKEGKVQTSGDQVKLGGNDIYKVVCRKHFQKLTKLL